MPYPVTRVLRLAGHCLLQNNSMTGCYSIPRLILLSCLLVFVSPDGDAQVKPPPPAVNQFINPLTGLVTASTNRLIAQAQEDLSTRTTIFGACMTPGNSDPNSTVQTQFYRALQGLVDDSLKKIYTRRAFRIRPFEGLTIDQARSFATQAMNVPSYRTETNQRLAAICNKLKPQAPVNTPPRVEAGPSKTITLPVNVVRLEGSATDAEGNIRTYRWTKYFGPAGDNIESPNQAQTNVSFTQPGYYIYQLEVRDRFEAFGRDTVGVTVNPAAPPPSRPIANAGPDQVLVAPVNSTTLNGQGSDPQGLPVTYRWSVVDPQDRAQIISPTSPQTPVQNLDIGTHRFQLTVTNSRRLSATSTVQIRVDQQRVRPPVVDAGPNQVIQLPTNTATLTGSARDPQGLPLRYRWSVIGGLGSGQISSTNSPTTFVQNLAAGSYQFVLTATNSAGQSGQDTTRVDVTIRANHPPKADAGPNQLITLPEDSVVLIGNGTDQDGDILTYRWRQRSGKSNAQIVSPTFSTTVVTGLEAGTYQFVFTVSDGHNGFDSAITQVTVRRRLQVPATKYPPEANAGPDLSISTTTAMVTGFGTDRDGRIVSYEWTKLAGPEKYTIVSPRNAKTEIRGLVSGEYEFELKVTDNDGLVGTDRMLLRVDTGPGGINGWIWIPISLGLLAAAVVSSRWFWWLRQKEKVITFFVNQEEEALAQKFFPGHHKTQGYYLGHASRARIRQMKKHGLALLVLDTRTLTVSTPGVIRTYKFGFKKGQPILKSITPVYTGTNFVNMQAGMNMVQPSEPGLPAYYIITLDCPLLPVFREELDKIGLPVLQRIPNDSYTVFIKEKNQLDRLRQDDAFKFIRIIRPYTSEDIGFTVRKDNYSRLLNKGADGWLVLDIILHREEDRGIVNDFLGANGVERMGYSGRTIRVRVRAGTESMAVLTSNKYIQAIYEYVPPSLNNDVARQMIGLDLDASGMASLHEDGKGEIIAVADTGIDLTHPDLKQGIIQAVAWGRKDNTTDPHGHGTHVTGTIIGNGSASNGSIRGMAPGARVFFQSLLDDTDKLCDLGLKLGDLLDQAYKNQARIINMSWGAATESKYTSDSLAIDEFAYAHPEFLVVVSAGNEGKAKQGTDGQDHAGYGSLNSTATNKNGLTVGASRSRRLNEDPEAIAGFSSRGPCEADWRIKPDIVAPGTNILSTKSSIAPDRNFDSFYTNDAYVFLSGTSMATPVVSGAAAITRQYFREKKGYQNPSAALIKAVLINGTHRLAANSALEDSRVIPNNDQGYGMLNMLETIPNNKNNFQLWYCDSLKDSSLVFNITGEKRIFQVRLSQGSWLRACLVFVANPAAGAPSDLDLIVSNEGGLSKWTGNAGINARDRYFSKNEKDATNTVEIVRLDNLEAGTYRIEVVATNIVSKTGVGFALVVTTGDLQGQFSRIEL